MHEVGIEPLAQRDDVGARRVGKPPGRELLGRLLGRADLLVSNLSRDRLERWELRGDLTTAAIDAARGAT